MKCYIITIVDNNLSVDSANKCIESAKEFGLDISIWPAITPRHTEFEELQCLLGIQKERFESHYSRRDNAIACFLSMAGLWVHAVETNENILILEHDARMSNKWPSDFVFDKVCTVGKPSFGAFNTPDNTGTGPLIQKKYFGGAHAYIVSPAGAQILLDNIPSLGMPTDVYLSLDHFNFLEEYYPWLFYVDDSFSTVQKNNGCLAKHNYTKGIKLIEP